MAPPTGYNKQVGINLSQTENIPRFKEPVVVPVSSDSTTSGDYELYDDCETGVITDIWTVAGSGSAAYSTDKAHGGNKSIKIVGHSVGQSVKYSFTGNNHTVEAWVYDDLTATNPYWFISYFCTGPQSWEAMVRYSTSTTHYTYYNNSSWTATNIERSTGWHKITYIRNGSTLDIYIDDKLIASETVATAVNIGLWNYYIAGGDPVYWDDIKISDNEQYLPQTKSVAYTNTYGNDLRIVGMADSWEESDYTLMEGDKDIADGTTLGTRGWTFVVGSAGDTQYVSTKGNEIKKYVEITSPDAAGVQVWKSFSAKKGVMEYEFYDENIQAGTVNQYYRCAKDTSDYQFQAGILSAQSATNYVYLNQAGGGWQITNIKRTKGFHKFKFVHDGSYIRFYIDDIYVTTGTANFSTFATVEFIMSGSGLSGKTKWFNVRVGDSLEGVLPTEEREIPSQLVYQDVVFSDNAEGEIDGVTLSGANGWSIGAGTVTYSKTQVHSGTKSIKVAAGGQVNHTHSTTPAITECWMYDDGGTTGNSILQILGSAGTLYFGVINASSTTHYSYYDGSNHTTSVARVTGWHHLKLVDDGTNEIGYIDGTQIFSVSVMTSINGLRLESATMVPYFDDVRVFKGYDKPTGVMFLPDSEYKAVVSMEDDTNNRAFWKFENNLTDERGSFDLTDNGTTPFSSSEKIVGSYSLGTFSSSNYVKLVSDSTLFDATLRDKGCIDCWFKTGSDVATEQYIFAKYSASNNVYMKVSSGELEAGINAKNVGTGTSWLSASTWYHAQFRWAKGQDGTNYIYELYVNGHLMERIADGGAVINYTADFTIGNSTQTPASQYFRGYIDELRISRIDRTPMGIAQDYKLYYDDSDATPAKYNCPYELIWGAGETLLTFESPIHKAVFTDDGVIEHYYFRGGSTWKQSTAGGWCWVNHSGGGIFNSNIDSALNAIKRKSGAINFQVGYIKSTDEIIWDVYSENPYIEFVPIIRAYSTIQIGTMTVYHIGGVSAQHYTFFGNDTTEVSSDTFKTNIKGFEGARVTGGTQYGWGVWDETNETDADDSKMYPGLTPTRVFFNTEQSGDSYPIKTSNWKIRLGATDGYI